LRLSLECFVSVAPCPGIRTYSFHEVRIATQIRDKLSWEGGRDAFISSHTQPAEKEFSAALKNCVYIAQTILSTSYRKDSPMPFYEYICKKCDKIFTITMSIAEHEKKKVKCPECKGTNLVPQFRSFYAKTSRKS
jgi:putative FmdB family regulatory protein